MRLTKAHRVIALSLLIGAAVAPTSRAPLAAQASTPRECLATNGIAYGPFRDGQGPEGSLPIYPRVEQIEEDLRFLAPSTKRIRTYSTSSTQADIPRLAKPFGISVAQGIALGPDEEENER